MSENKKSKQSAYEQQESRLSAQSVAFIKLLTQRGILGDAEIDDDKIRQAQKRKSAIHITTQKCFCSITGILCGRWSASPRRLWRNWIVPWTIWMRSSVMWMWK